jgi:putative transposase
MQKIPKQAYTAEFKEQAVKRVKDGKRVSAVAKEMGLVEQSLRNRVKAFDVGRLNGAGAANAGGDGAVASARAERAAQARGRDLKKSDGVLRAGCAVKDAWIAAHRDGFALNELCTVLEVSVGGYRAWQGGGTPDRRGLTDAQLPALIRSIHAALKGAYGSPRMMRELRARGICTSTARVERLMREHGIRGRHTRRDTATTDSKHSLPVAENRLARDVAPSGPNQVRSADSMELWTDEGWLYLAIAPGLFNRAVVGWSPKPRMTADPVGDALTMGWFRRKPAPRADPSFRSGEPVRQSCLPGQTGRVRHGLLDEP